MIINQITYAAKGQVAGLDDIITLRLKFFDRSGNVIGTSMISGHSILLTNSVYELEPIDVDSISVEATDLDYEGHTLKFNNYEYAIPMTGSVSRSYQIASVGAPVVTELAVPEREKFLEVVGLPMPGEGVPAVSKPAAIGGAGIVVLGIIALLALGGRKKK